MIAKEIEAFECIMTFYGGQFASIVGRSKPFGTWFYIYNSISEASRDI